MESSTPQLQTLERLKSYIECRYPLIYLVSWEELRVERLIRDLARRMFNPPKPLWVWTCTEGIKSPEGIVEGTTDPQSLLSHMLKSDAPGLYLAKDLSIFFQNNPYLIRKLRDFAARAKFSGQTLILLSPALTIPEEIQKDTGILDFALPSLDEIGGLFDLLGEEHRQRSNLKINLNSKQREQFLSAALGLTLAEAEKAFTLVMQGKQILTINDIDRVIEEKTNFIKISTALEFIPHTIKFKDLGGLERLKKWAQERSAGFTAKAKAYGLPIPKGLMITGISGCGKSLAIKALANLWQLPLLRLDFSQIYSGIFGTPEDALRRALKTMEAIAPAFLWIDEIEMGFSGAEQGRETTAVRVFSYFLTWMQEKKVPVFVGATANDIDRLPPELLRKGRFDEIFFVDLPTAPEREEIFKIHLENRNNDVSRVTLQGLSKQTEGWSGAEIEEGIVSAMYRSFSENRNMTIDDIFITIGSTVPLSITMDEQIKRTKRWADKRARKASKSETRI